MHFLILYFELVNFSAVLKTQNGPLLRRQTTIEDR